MANVSLRDLRIVPRRQGRLGDWLSGGSEGRGFVIKGLNLDIPHAQTTVVLGPSGCGKSTLLRAIAGLMPASGGQILYGGEDVEGVPPRNRNIGFLFQNYALYPHFNVRDNITAYFRFRKQTPELGARREAALRRTSELLDVDISYLLDRSPRGLSGGEKQRVALGRCITREPELFLLDEPFSNLDAQLRTRYREHLKTLLRELSITTVYVTHDQQEATLLGHRIAIMNKTRHDGVMYGQLEQVGILWELYERPASAFVAEFLNPHPHLPAIAFVDARLFDPALARIVVGIRPEHARLATPSESPAVVGRVRDVGHDALGRHRVVTVELGVGANSDSGPPTRSADPTPGDGRGAHGTEISAAIFTNEAIAAGDEVRLRFAKLHAFDRDTGAVRSFPPALAVYQDEASGHPAG